ncbi:MAG TPA: EAL domain-containing protein [Burkholderiaceae bacterium]|nr:EAL domain-containing protein [Burkholderiaceae bacterium]
MDTRNSIRLVSDRLMRLAAAACLLVGLGLSVAAWYHVAGVMRTDGQRSFDRFSAQADAGIEDRARSHLFAISGFHGLFTVSEHVSRAEFHDQFERLRGGRWHPGLLAVQYLERVPEAARTAFEAEVRADTSLVAGGYPDFAIQSIVPRAHYLVTKYSEPPQTGALAIGVDLVAQRDHDDALQRAAESGMPMATAPVRLDESTLGYSVYFAVYARHRPLETPQQRLAALRGYVRGVFRTASMFDDVLPQEQVDGYRVWIEDLGGATPGDAPAILFDSDPSSSIEQPEPGSGREHTYSAVIGERAWMVHTLRPVVRTATAPWPLTVLLCGVALSLGLWIMLHAGASQYGRATTLARRLSREAEESATQLRNVIDHSADGIVTIDARAALLSANPSAQRMFGRSADELVGRPLVELFDPAARDEMNAWLGQATAAAEPGAGEREEIALRADGSRFPLAMAFNRIDGLQPGLRVGTLRDISERRRIESQMHVMARHDALTGLPNRLLLLERLQQAIAAAGLSGVAPARHVGLMFIDLDRFKTINDSLGHHVGDRVLTEVARRLQAVVRSSDTVARMGGDEFVIVLPQMKAAADAESIAHKVLHALHAPVRVEDHDLAVTVSVGLATWPDMAEDAASLMSRADAAMYSAKRAGRNNWAWFDTVQATAMPHLLQLENDLRHALERGQLALHFQPQYACAGGALVGAEALLRWHHPKLGMVSPADFIPLAEETGLIVSIGKWVLGEALRHAVQWQGRDGGALRVAVNLSPRQMDSDVVVQMVADALAESGLPARLLELEITEGSVVRDVERSAMRLSRLAELGVSIAIDDFGVGYSSLSYLRDLPVRKLKIDRSFISPLPGDKGAARMVAALVAMAHELQMEVVAEGVETVEQLALVREFGCETAQGFLLGRPLEAQRFAALAGTREPARVDENFRPNLVQDCSA